MPFKPKFGLKGAPDGDGYTMVVFGRWPDDLDFPEAQAVHSSIVKSWREVWGQRQNVLADETIMPLARMRAAQEFAARRLHRTQGEALAAIGAYIDKMDAAHKRLKRATGAPDTAGEAQVDAEIRAHLRTLKGEERFKAVHAAAEAGDKTVLRAVASAPGFLSGLSGPMHTQAYEAYAQKVAPDDLHRTRTYSAAVEMLTKATREFEEHVTSLADLGDDWKKLIPWNEGGPPPSGNG